MVIQLKKYMRYSKSRSTTWWADELCLSPLWTALHFGFSVYTGEPDGHGHADVGLSTEWGDHISYGAQFEYQLHPWTVRAEIARHDDPEIIQDSAYAEVAYYFTEHWQLAGRVETVDTDYVDADLLPVSSLSLLDHDEIVVGLNYWFSDNFVFKLSYHDLDGNLFLFPEGDALFDVIAEDQLDQSNRLINFGMQFSF